MKYPRQTFSILVVDDEKKICRLISSFLSLSTYIDKVVMANSALEALQKLSNQKFDLMITDQVMTGKDGMSLIEHVTKVPKYQNMSIILVSGFLKQEILLRAIHRGVKKIVIKPFTRLQILNCVYEVLNLEKSAGTILYKNLGDVSIDKVEDEESDDTDFSGYE